MYASVRRYKIDSGPEVARRVNEELIPRVSNITGFLAYYVIDTGEGVLASLSVFECEPGGEVSFCEPIAGRLTQSHPMPSLWN